MENRLRSFLLMIAAPVAAVVIALLFSTILLLLAGSNPWTAFGDMIEHGTTLETVIDMLNRATPLYVSGIAAAIGFKMNLFNIGVEGQYRIAGLAAGWVAGAALLPGYANTALAVLAAMVVGALWAGIAGWLRVYRGVSEVICP